MKLSRGRESAVLRLLVERGRVKPDVLAACRAEAEQLRAEGKDASALDLLLERGHVDARTVSEMACLESVRLSGVVKSVTNTLLGITAVVVLGIAAWAVITAGDRRLDAAALSLRRVKSATADDPREVYLARKQWESDQGARQLAARAGQIERSKGEDLVRKAEEERLLAEDERKRREAEEGGKAEEERKRREAEEAAAGRDTAELAVARAEFERFVPEIENYVRIFKYRKAIGEYGQYRARVRFPQLQERIDRRVAEIERLAVLMDRLQEGVHRKILRDDKVRYGEDVATTGTISDATEEYLEVTIKQGYIRTRWDFMRPAQLMDLFRRLQLSPQEELLIGCFAFESGLTADAHALLLSAQRQKKELKPEVDAFLASKRGFASVPEGGFVPYQGKLITVEEKTKFEAGFIFYASQWIKPDEKVYVDKGWVKQDDKWIPREEADLLARGYRKYKEKWYSPEELVGLRSNWADAWEVATEHYRIRTNTTEAFANELARVMEQSFVAYQEHYNRKYEGPPMNIYGFRSFEDYRAFCIEQKLESHIPAAGHASGGKNYGCGYAKYGGNPELILTLVHEGSHLFYDRAVQGWVPSWYHEGQATYFEGFTWDGTTLAFNHVSKQRLPWLRQALTRGETIPIQDLIQGDALSSIQRGARDSTLFYSESWGLYYFLCHGPNEERKKKFSELREKYASRALGASVMTPAGALSSFVSVMGSDWDSLEAEWKEFILSLK